MSSHLLAAAAGLYNIRLCNNRLSPQAQDAGQDKLNYIVDSEPDGTGSGAEKKHILAVLFDRIDHRGYFVA